jgi:hypothetical protein
MHKTCIALARKLPPTFDVKLTSQAAELFLLGRKHPQPANVRTAAAAISKRIIVRSIY